MPRSLATRSRIITDPREILRHLPERDACGTGAVVNLAGNATRDVVRLTLNGVCDMDLRGAQANDTGDGAGVMVRTGTMRPFYERFISSDTHLPDNEQLHVGTIFVRKDERQNLDRHIEEIRRRLTNESGIRIVGWRTTEDIDHRRIEVDDRALGPDARETRPVMAQVLFTKGFRSEQELPLALYEAKLAMAEGTKAMDIISLERGTTLYKGMMTGSQLRRFFADFRHPDFATDAALFHTRFATNVLSRFELAQPFRLVAHNGEINTIRALRDSLRDLKQHLGLKGKILMRQGSDSGDIDRIIGLLHSHAIRLSESIRRVFRPTPDDIAHMQQALQDYFLGVQLAHGPLAATEGPAAIVGMDDEEVVAALDGLGLRPLRCIETKSGLVVFTSEIGAPHIPQRDIKRTFQLDAGELMFTRDGKAYYPDDANVDVVKKTPLNYAVLAEGKKFFLAGASEHVDRFDKVKVTRLWNLFGGDDALLHLITSMAREGREPVIGMGNDHPLAVFSRSYPRFAQYFHQIVAVVTNPPMDPIREGKSMSLKTRLGRKPRTHEHAHTYGPRPYIDLEHPFLTEEQMVNLLKQQDVPTHTVSTTFASDTSDSVHHLIERIEAIKKEVIASVRGRKHHVIVLSDRGVDDDSLYIPPALIAAVMHNELIKQGKRRNVSIVIDSGEVFEAHDCALLIAMGADAVNPYLVWQAIKSGLITDQLDAVEKRMGGSSLRVFKQENVQQEQILKTYVAMMKRIMSKMGITSIEGYRGSRLMEAVGIDSDIINYFMTCSESNLGGASLDDLVHDMMERRKVVDKIRENAEHHAYDGNIRKWMEKVCFGGEGGKIPDNTKEMYQRFVEAVEAQDPVYLRDLLGIISDPEHALDPAAVMSKEDLFAHHIRGAAMSHGALQYNAHRAIAGAFNELGGMSNSGEGGEHPDRNIGGKYEKDRSKIRQRASALFGGSAEYFGNAEEIEIKIGQGAKPGEGGHLSGFKIDAIIAHMRKTEPGMDLISPPPLHDVYSIEDLGRLIQDLRAINPRARIAVKITSNTDIGTVAVGVAKAGADVIGISGWEGGTGAASQSSIEHTGLPLEIGLAQAHQALAASGLRDLVKLRVDGGIKTGRDIVKLACLGADEFGLGTALLVAAERCIFCQSCSGQTQGSAPGRFKECPTGIMPVTPGARKKLGLGARKLKPGELGNDDESQYEHSKASAKNYLHLLAEDVQETLAAMGKTSLKEICGDTSLLKHVSRNDLADRLKLDTLLRDVRPLITQAQERAAKHKIDRGVIKKPAINRANRELIAAVEDAIHDGLSGRSSAVRMSVVRKKLSTKDRSYGATLSYKISRGEIVPPSEGIEIHTTGNAGQSLGFCLSKEVRIKHTGFANDFIAMASEGDVVIKQPGQNYRNDNSVGGNACGYAKSRGKLYLDGKVGQRFGVRNCGADQIAEETGKFPFEYMTSGYGMVVRKTGYQTGAGMGGGELYLRKDPSLPVYLHEDAMPAPWTVKSKEKAFSMLHDYYRETDNATAEALLATGVPLDHFQRVVPREHYVHAVTRILSFDFYAPEDGTVSLEDVTATAAHELAALLHGHDDASLVDDLKMRLTGLLTSFRQHAKETEAPYRYQEAKMYAREFLTAVVKK